MVLVLACTRHFLAPQDPSSSATHDSAHAHRLHFQRARCEQRASSRRRRYSAPSFSITTAADGMDPSGRSTSMPNARPPSFSVEPTLETATNGTDLRGGSVPPLPMHRLKGHGQKQVIDLRDLREQIGLIGENKT